MHSYQALLTDLYQLTMVGGYIREGKTKQRANFDYFFRNVPDKGGYCILAGLADIIEYIQRLRFKETDIQYLRKLEIFSEETLLYFEKFKFTGDIWAIPEGTVVFPHEPLIRVTAPLPEAQLIESILLNVMNFQTLIATKGARIRSAANGDTVIDFGLRRAHGPDGALMASRAAYIGGIDGTSNVAAGHCYGIPVQGTHAHSWVASFPDEEKAFRAYADIYPDTCLLLVDTYDTLKSGVPNAIRIGKELRSRGHEMMGIRLDSGDLAYLSKQARRMLDEAGFPKVKIVASGDLDEQIIVSLKRQKAKIDVWGVGTKLITSYSSPALGGVYKLTALDDGQGRMIPKIKRSDNPEKITNPGFKRVARVFDEKGRMRGDVLFLAEEAFPVTPPVQVFHPMLPHLFKTYPKDFQFREIMVPVFKSGRLVYKSPPVQQIRAQTLKNIDHLDDAYKRFRNPHIYHISLSRSLFETKQRLLREAVTT
ncbi:MAG: nicotinate phosphoribosyltransferase [Deltaproteobacteria bacterium]|nr:MAG: nicotinate phosphoribosyltransferase [Deltaproteobacteria bacterium]